MALVLAAKAQAARNIRNPDLWEVVREFFREEFHLPSTHESFQNASLEDLLVEMFETRFRKNPMAAHTNEDGRIQFQTGDGFIDKWESEYARGIMPDLTEAMTTQQIAEMNAAKARIAAEEAAVARLKAAQGGGSGAASLGAGGAVASSWKQVHDMAKAATSGI